MVLLEITLATAYFLGLKRTYKLALRIQRKLVSPKYPKVRGFLQGRSRMAFDFALSTHLKIQERDIEVGRNLGNWILRWLDRMKPEAQIRGPPLSRPKQLTNSSQMNNQGGFSKSNPTMGEGNSDRRLFSSARRVWRNPLSSIAMIARRTRPSGPGIQSRQFANRGAIFSLGMI